MTSTTPTPPPASKAPPSSPSAPGARLAKVPEFPKWWPTTLLLSFVATVAATTAVWLYAGGVAQFGTVALVVVVGLAVTACATALALRRDCRTEMTLTAVERLAPLVGQRPESMILRARFWKGWPVGAPGRVTAPCARTVDTTDSRWQHETLDILQSAFGRRYRLKRRKQLRNRLTWTRMPTEPEADPVETTPVRQRAELVVEKLLGKPASISSYIEHDDDHQVVVDLPTDPRLAGPSNQTRIETVWSTMMPGRWAAAFDLERDQVTFRRRRRMPTVVPRPAASVEDADHYKIPLAVDEHDENVVWDLKSAAPHALVTGDTATGKTNLIRGAVMDITNRNWAVWVIDPKRIEFVGLRNWPNVQLIATTIPEQIAAIYRAHDIMEARYAKVEAGEADEDDFEPLVIIIDEYRTWMKLVTGWYATQKQPRSGMPSQCPVFELVGNMTAMGRSGAVHILVGTQRPDAALLKEGQRDNYRTRVSLSRLSPQGAVMMWDSPAVGVTIPTNIRGRGSGLTADGTPVELQTYWTPDPRKAKSQDDRNIVDRLRPSTVKHEPLRIQLAEEYLQTEDLDGKAQQPSMWKAVTEAQLVPSSGQPLVGEENPPRRSAKPFELRHTTEPDDNDGEEHTGPLEDPFAAFTSAEELRPEYLQTGDLVLVDDVTDHWAIAAEVGPDILDDSLICIDWRSDDDEDGTLQVPAGETVIARRPLDSPTELEV